MYASLAGLHRVCTRGVLRSSPHAPHTRPFPPIATRSVATRARAPASVSAVGQRYLSTQAAQPVRSRAVGWWFAGISAMVFGTVSLGGVTRLTESGLSMTNWSFVGRRPPWSQEEWEAEFEEYKKFPEYSQVHSSMTLEEYKFIFYMEYGHRMWGRCIGIAFAVPAAIFAARGHFKEAWVKRRVGLVGSLIVFQGFLGWYMVKSGLDGDAEDPTFIARVSQHRLASHLGTAFTIYGLALTAAFRHLAHPVPFAAAGTAAAAVRRLAPPSKGLVALSFVTAISGALVAGMDAGLVYNSFPKFADRWIPSDILALDPPMRNMLENATTVQFQHRVLGMTTAACVAATWVLVRRGRLTQCANVFEAAAGTGTKTVPASTSAVAAVAQAKRVERGAHMLLGMVAVQVSLGVGTLLYFVPVPLAAAHQAGSLTLLSLAIWLAHLLRRVR